MGRGGKSAVTTSGKENEDARGAARAKGSSDAPRRTALECESRIECVVEDAMVQLDERVRELRVVDARVRGGGVEGEREVEFDFDARVGEIVGDWLSDFDSITAEADRVCGLSLQTLYPALRGDEKLEKLRLDKSALKRRLRRFDARILQTCGKKTTKHDKGYLRPLYVRLAKIKDLIAIRESELRLRG
jgi:hypothetical protein